MRNPKIQKYKHPKNPKNKKETFQKSKKTNFGDPQILMLSDMRAFDRISCLNLTITFEIPRTYIHKIAGKAVPAELPAIVIKTPWVPLIFAQVFRYIQQLGVTVSFNSPPNGHLFINTSNLVLIKTGAGQDS